MARKKPDGRRTFEERSQEAVKAAAKEVRELLEMLDDPELLSDRGCVEVGFGLSLLYRLASGARSTAPQPRHGLGRECGHPRRPGPPLERRRRLARRGSAGGSARAEGLCPCPPRGRESSGEEPVVSLRLDPASLAERAN